MEKCDDEKLKADNNNMNLNLNLGRLSFEKSFGVTHIVQIRAILNQELNDRIFLKGTYIETLIHYSFH